jgi:hypothetical protein
MTSRLAPPHELVEDRYGYHLPENAQRSWKTLEQSCIQIITVLRLFFNKKNPKIVFSCSAPLNPSDFGYCKSYQTEAKARYALSQSLDAFVLLFAYVSFCIALCRESDDPVSISSSSSPSMQPGWFQHLSLKESNLHLEWLCLLADSSIPDFTDTSTRVGTIVNVSRCSWFVLVPFMKKANVPIWFYWGIPPLFLQPLSHHALIFAPRSHPRFPAPPSPVITPSQSVDLPTPSRSVGPPTPSQSVGLPTPSRSVGPPTPSQSVSLRSGQLPNETWQNFMERQELRKKAILAKENDVERQAREGRDISAASRSCPGKRGATVFIWEKEKDVWKRTLVTRAQVEREWGRFRTSQKVFNSFDNCYELCKEFDAGTLGEKNDYDSNDSENDTYCPPTKISRRSLTPTNGRSGDDSTRPSIVVDSESTPDCTPMDVDPSDPASQSVPTPAQVASDCPPMDVDPSDPASQSVPTPAQVASDCPPPMPIDSESLRAPHSEDGSDDLDDQDSYEASKQDVLNAYSFGPPNLEVMPVTSLDDLLYFRYGFSLNESPYTGIPSSVSKDGTRAINTWSIACRVVGGQNLESSGVENESAIKHFLSILAGSPDPFNGVPGKYWDLSALGHRPFVELEAFIYIEERQFSNRKDKQYFIRPRDLHPSRDTSWLISVDSMTALECIRRRLGPHTIHIADFLISHGVRFRALQRIFNSEELQAPFHPHIRYLGYRPDKYIFDVADFAGYEEMRDSFFRSQSHGPLALREGGIIARLAREVLPNANALSGPSSEALSGHRARFISGDETYVDDEFSEDEFGLICGTYVLGNPNPNSKKGNEFTFLSSCY